MLKKQLIKFRQIKILLVVTIVVIVTAHYLKRPRKHTQRNILHLREEHFFGEVLYDQNGVLLNGKHFDLQI